MLDNLVPIKIGMLFINYQLAISLCVMFYIIIFRLEKINKLKYRLYILCFLKYTTNKERNNFESFLLSGMIINVRNCQCYACETC